MIGNHIEISPDLLSHPDMAVSEEGDARFIMPPNLLKEKVGSGGLPLSVIQRADEVIRDTEIDFTPTAQILMRGIENALKTAEQDGMRTRTHITLLSGPIMQMKANCGMFGYPLLSDIAAISLGFLENVVVLDDDAMAVIRAHIKTMTIVLAQGLRGHGGKQGIHLIAELRKVCDRYYRRYDIKPNFP